MATADRSSELETVLDAVGPRLRMLRAQREITLAQLAERTGISVSTLSRLESGGRRPTLELMLPLARAYDVSIDELVDAPPTGDPRVHMRPVRRYGMTLIPLTRRAGGVQAYKMILPARSRSGPPDPKTHEGYEWLYVLEGRLRMILGEQELVLLPGEAAEFDTRVPHWFASADGRPVEILALVGPQGQRAHLRARSTPVKNGTAQKNDPAQKHGTTQKHDTAQKHRISTKDRVPLTACAVQKPNTSHKHG